MNHVDRLVHGQRAGGQLPHLVWLLKRLLYKPILHAIDEREKRIAAQLQNAETKENEAQKECEEFQRKNEEWAAQRDAR